MFFGQSTLPAQRSTTPRLLPNLFGAHVYHFVALKQTNKNIKRLQQKHEKKNVRRMSGVHIRRPPFQRFLCGLVEPAACIALHGSGQQEEQQGLRPQARQKQLKLEGSLEATEWEKKDQRDDQQGGWKSTSQISSAVGDPRSLGVTRNENDIVPIYLCNRNSPLYMQCYCNYKPDNI